MIGRLIWIIGLQIINFYCFYCIGWLRKTMQTNNSFLKVIHRLQGDITPQESSDITKSLFDIPLDRSEAPLAIKGLDWLVNLRNKKKYESKTH